jgi:hypothetical protein
MSLSPLDIETGGRFPGLYSKAPPAATDAAWFGPSSQQCMDGLIRPGLPGWTGLAHLDLLRDSGIDIPVELEDVRELTPFAVEFRYSELPLEDEGPSDRAWARSCVSKTRAWAEIRSVELVPTGGRESSESALFEKFAPCPAS